MAKLLNKVLKGKADDEQIKALTRKYKHPWNVEFLQVPKVDVQLWRQLGSSVKIQDHLLLRAQGTLSLALIPLSKALGKVTGIKNPELKKLLADSFKILTHCITSEFSDGIRSRKIWTQVPVYLFE